MPLFILTRKILINLIVLFLMMSSLKMSVFSGHFISLVSGVSVALILLRGPIISVGIFLGIFLGFMAEKSSFQTAVLGGVIYFFQAIMIYYLLFWIQNPAIYFRAIKTGIKAIFLILFISFISSYSLSIIIPFFSFNLIFLANSLGIFMVSFLIMALDRNFPSSNKTKFIFYVVMLFLCVLV